MRHGILVKIASSPSADAAQKQVVSYDNHDPAADYSILIACDDEEPRALLMRYASEHPSAGDIDECASGHTIIDCIRERQPDVVVVVASGQFDSVDLIESIASAGMHTMVLVADSGEYAVRAFELQLADYLVNPVAHDRFVAALDHAISRVRRAEERQLSVSLTRLFHDLHSRTQKPARFLVQEKSKYRFVQANEIDWIEAADNYVILHVGDRQYFVRDTMSNMEARLERDRFVRIKRSAIVNVDSVAWVEPWSGTEYRLVLTNGTILVSGRRFKENLRAGLLRG